MHNPTTASWVNEGCKPNKQRAGAEGKLTIHPLPLRVQPPKAASILASGILVTRA